MSENRVQVSRTTGAEKQVCKNSWPSISRLWCGWVNIWSKDQARSQSDDAGATCPAKGSGSDSIADGKPIRNWETCIISYNLRVYLLGLSVLIRKIRNDESISQFLWLFDDTVYTQYTKIYSQHTSPSTLTVIPTVVSAIVLLPKKLLRETPTSRLPFGKKEIVLRILHIYQAFLHIYSILTIMRYSS